jgi:hypothetical protein
LVVGLVSEISVVEAPAVVPGAVSVTSVTGQTVVEMAIVSVTTRGVLGQFVTSGAQEVTVRIVVV